MIETVERRVFGAIEFIDDLTDARIAEGLRVSGAGVSLLRKANGLFVIREVDGHDAYTRAFDDPPSIPPRTDFTFRVDDPAQRYVAQAFTLALPRRLDPGGADSALVPVAVRLVPAAALTVRAGWAVLRLQVVVAGSNPPLGLANVLVEASPQPAGIAARRTLTDRHGEALVVIASAPPFLPDAGPAGLTREFGVALTLVLDAQVVRAGNEASLPLPDPALIAQRRAAAHPDIRVVAVADQPMSAGASRRRVEAVPWP